MSDQFTPKCGIQFWKRTPPTKRDSLLVLMRALELLSESIPIALGHVGSEAIEVQEKFWRAFIQFDRYTDITETRKDHNTDYATAIGMTLEDWREVVEVRSYTPTGDLTEEDPNAA